MKKQPLLILVICFILGIFFQEYVVLNDLKINIVGGCVLILIILSFISLDSISRIKPYFLSIAFLGLGIISHDASSLVVRTPFENKEVEIVFEVDKKLNSNAAFKRYEVIANIGDEQSTILLCIPKSHPDLDFIHYYKVNAYLSKVRAPEFDFQFNYARFLARRNINFIAYSKGDIALAEKSEVAFTDRVKQWRWKLLRNIDASSLSASTKEFLKGIILSDRTEIDENTMRDFNRSGLIHFLAISGTHIVIIFGLFYWLLMRFSPKSFRKIAVILSILFIWSFALFIGFGNSVVRSCIMLTVYYIYVLLQRKPDVLHALAVSAFLILIIDTQQIFDIGFQLSFLAVLGIFWFNQPILMHFPAQDSTVKKIIFNTISISISAQLATLPVVLFYFHQFSIISIFANFFIVPFSEIIIVFSFLMTLLFWIGIPFDFLLKMYDFTIQILLKIIHWFASWDDLFIEDISIGILEMMAFFFILFRLRFLVKKVNWTNFYKFAFAFFIFALLRMSFSIYYSNKEEFLIYQNKKDIVVVAKFGDKARFYINRDANYEKIRTYFIRPYCVSNRIKSIDVNRFPTGYNKVVFNGKAYTLK